jgi:hypothetical protein
MHFNHKSIEMKMSFLKGFSIAALSYALFLALSSYTTLRPAAEKNRSPSKLIDNEPFTPNKGEGWGSYSSYIRNDGDTVEVELILYRKLPTGGHWNTTTEFGKIDPEFRPKKECLIKYNEPNRVWTIIVHKNGNCYLQLVSGAAPTGDPVILPIQTKYIK